MTPTDTELRDRLAEECARLDEWGDVEAGFKEGWDSAATHVSEPLRKEIARERKLRKEVQDKLRDCSRGVERLSKRQDSCVARILEKDAEIERLREKNRVLTEALERFVDWDETCHDDGSHSESDWTHALNAARAALAESEGQE